MDKKRATEIVAGMAGLRIGVIGDLMLDCYIIGHVTRISPEAPVPVLQVSQETYRLGGAANVMQNIVNLGAKAVAFGVIGQDHEGRLICRELEQNDIDSDNVLADRTRRTTKKSRVLASTQQLIRIDHEVVENISAELENELVSAVERAIDNGELDVIIFEDYGKGVLSTNLVEKINAAARRKNVITALDPKPGHLKPVKGIGVMKPNRVEAYQMASCPEKDDVGGEVTSLQEVANILSQLWDPAYLIISLAAEGMAVFERDGKETRIPTRAREVFDVSGAGDTVIAAFTLAVAAGADAREAADFANHAAGVVVGKVGTAPVTLDELFKSFDR